MKKPAAGKAAGFFVLINSIINLIPKHLSIKTYYVYLKNLKLPL